ncbi:uncharacterized protein EI90DRAFT_3013429 [Cantharellus anzutake]|uniref:uncharacterized protein n=1 Tax=Cantharellus anzutake TaxID=1750568 RepID=UPI001907E2AA|nr:uncharacterized protein EI90DRAFT_3013429 [Cantharellus anzutake]KAF8338119.1 hypothetical protein EI90DRAFT_3013429 [Cantharellus anzutake]
MVTSYERSLVYLGAIRRIRETKVEIGEIHNSVTGGLRWHSISCGYILQVEQALAWRPSVLGNNLLAGASAPTEPWGYGNFIYDVDHPNPISLPKGSKGNWANPDESLLVNIVPGAGRRTRPKGNGTVGVSNTVIMSVATSWGFFVTQMQDR